MAFRKKKRKRMEKRNKNGTETENIYLDLDFGFLDSYHFTFVHLEYLNQKKKPSEAFNW